MKSRTKIVALAGIVLLVGGLSASCAKKTTKTATAAGGAGLQRIHYDFDKYNIKSEYEGVLKSNSEWLAKNKSAKTVVEGHCDERGTAEYNIALGDRRAKSAANYLKTLGVDASRFSTVSYGEERPAAPCHDESCWWQNRRAEFVAK